MSASGGGCVEVEAGEQAGDGVGELLPHPALAAVVGEARASLLGGVVDGDPVDQEPFAELRHHGVVLVEHGGGAGEQADAAFPVQAAAAVDADQPRPGAVEQLAQRGEHARRARRGASRGSSRSL